MKIFTAQEARDNVLNYKAMKVDEARKEADIYLEGIYNQIRERSAMGKGEANFNFSALDELTRDFVLKELRNAGYRVNGTTNWHNARVLWDGK